jgi:hypothetical protein
MDENQPAIQSQGALPDSDNQQRKKVDMLLGGINEPQLFDIWVEPLKSR